MEGVCTLIEQRYKAKLDVFDKVHSMVGIRTISNVIFLQQVEVNGKNVNPLYQFLRAKSDPSNIAWNFGKFLVSKDGKKVCSQPPH